MAESLQKKLADCSLLPCGICHETLSDGLLVLVPCGHPFHTRCMELLKTLKKNEGENKRSKCPKCQR